MEFIYRLYIILLCVALLDFPSFYLLCRMGKIKDSQCGLNEEKAISVQEQGVWSSIIRTISTIISIILYEIFVAFLLLYNRDNILVWIIVAGAFLLIIIQKCSPFPVIGFIIKGKGYGNLTKKEHGVLFVITSGVMSLFVYVGVDEFYHFVFEYPNKIYADWMLIAFYVVMISGLTFLILALVTNPIKLFLYIIHKLLSLMPLHKVGLYSSKVDNLVIKILYHKIISGVLIKYSRQCNIRTRLLMWILFIPVVGIDIVRGIIGFVIMVFISLIWYFIRFLFLTCGICDKFTIWMLSLSDRRVIAISFRIAIAVGFLCTVIINRYTPFLNYQEKSTAVFEFLSSVVMIPIVLDWIQSLKKN